MSRRALRDSEIFGQLSKSYDNPHHLITYATIFEVVLSVWKFLSVYISIVPRVHWFRLGLRLRLNP